MIDAAQMMGIDQFQDRRQSAAPLRFRWPGAALSEKCVDDRQKIRGRKPDMKHLAKLILTAAILVTTATAAMADGAKIAVVGGKSDDPFFAKIKKGIDDATFQEGD
jgi:hypothetical protein